ncbi:MAG: Uma2 family endonuclease [Cyanobacteria bacterium CRU_2_1]|nr:Uma2 family endonuclease [Cyanobacteria bacterium RU_5_0]NJR58131.1 Uma2 family endonuclease [Cyanobacteria bacterium CRU_2_1]
MTAYTINLAPILKMTDEQFYKLCRANPDIKFERNAKEELLIMPPTGGETGKFNAELSADFVIWNRQTKLGVVFDSSTCFKLPNGADRSPDISWIRQDRWDRLTSKQKEKFPPICPDFILELRSPTDSLETLQAKMREYIENGAQLGWLINRHDRQVEIYHPERAVEVLQTPADVFGDPVLPGFALNLQWIWRS